MNPAPLHPEDRGVNPHDAIVALTDAELVRRREEIRRGLVRSNTAIVVALVITIGLAVAAVGYAFLAERHAASTHRAHERRTEELWNSQLARAMALRLSGKVGRRQESLRAITNAVSIRPSRELRDEAIATLALMDIQPGTLWRPASPNVHAYGMSPRLNFYALGDYAGKVEVFAASNGQSALTFSRERQTVFSVHFSPDERLVAARWEAGAVEVWNLPERRRVFADAYPQREPSTDSITFHPESRRVAVACADDTVRILNLESNLVERALKMEGRPWTAAFDPSGSRLAVGVGRRLELYAHPSGEKLASFETTEVLGRLDWHPHGHVIAAGSPNGRVTLVDVRTGRLKAFDAHTQRTIRLAFHPSGRLFASASWDGGTRFWDAGSGRLLLQTQAGFALQYDVTGQRLGFFREGRGIGDWQIDLDTMFGTVELPFGIHPEVIAVAVSQEGRWLASTTRESVHLWECATGRELDSMKWARSWGAAFTTDDRALLLSSDTGLFRVPLRTGTAGEAPRFEKPQPIPGTPRGSFAHGTITHGPRRYFGAEGSPNHVFVDLAPPHSVLTLPGRWDNSAPSTFNGRLACTSRWKGQGTRVWDLDSQKQLQTLSDEGGVSLFSPDGRWLVVGTSTEILFYETESWQLSRKLARDSASAISGLLAFSPDGQILAITHTLRQVRLLAPDSGATLANLDAPSPERITALSFSGDGSVLAAGTDNGEIQVWNLRELRQCLRAMRLDWAEATSSPTATLGHAEPATSARNRRETAPALTPQHGAIWLSGTGASLALFFALYSIRHHRRLVTAYAAVEEIAAHRRRDLEAAQMQLLQSHKMRALGTLAAGVAHDFNNLLSIIRMAGQLVTRQTKPTGLTKENLDAIEHAVAQGKDIVRSILGYSRQPADSKAGYSVKSAVSETLAMLSRQFLSGVVLTLELDKDTPPVRGDQTRLEQILLNLIVNAAEAMQGKGSLLIQVRIAAPAGKCALAPRAARQYVEVVVRDSGPGIPSNVLPRVFEPFFTTKQGRSEHGTGLGLTTVYTIAQQDGMGLGVETEMGSGTAFRVWLPVLAEPEALA